MAHGARHAGPISLTSQAWVATHLISLKTSRLQLPSDPLTFFFSSGISIGPRFSTQDFPLPAHGYQKSEGTAFGPQNLDFSALVNGLGFLFTQSISKLLELPVILN
jgi:hypothetical protein